ncbi:MAG TPA: phosphatidate cytidylyltransferase [Verrucomicrobiae bacterium]|nr:phosphatidate cytidylyltransferase [Verrucomicrobiae bacterium]
MLLTRVISAAILGPLLLYVLFLGGNYLLVVTLLLTLVALHELFNMSRGLGFKAWQNVGYLAALFVVLAAYFEQGKYLPLMLVVWLLICLSYIVINFPQQGIGNLGFNFLAVLYVSLLFAHMPLLRNLAQGTYLIFLTFVTTWATDTGAYFAGRAMGRNKLAPKVSPNKTVEGAIGGLVAAALVAAAIGYLVPNNAFTTTKLVLLGIAVAITGQMGDLAESAIKRFAGVKDSGKLIPGHGGVLDRFDSVLFTIPTVYYIFLGLIIS